MPASGVIKLLDANIWLAVAADGHTHHARAARWFNSESETTLAFCRVTQMALLRHLTNSRIMGENVQTQAEAWQTYERFLGDPRIVFLVEPPNLDATFRRLTSADTPSHERWTDAYLAAFAMASEAQLVSFDRGLRRFGGVDLFVLG